MAVDGPAAAGPDSCPLEPDCDQASSAGTSGGHRRARRDGEAASSSRTQRRCRADHRGKVADWAAVSARQAETALGSNAQRVGQGRGGRRQRRQQALAQAWAERQTSAEAAEAKDKLVKSVLATFTKAPGRWSGAGSDVWMFGEPGPQHSRGLEWQQVAPAFKDLPRGVSDESSPSPAESAPFEGATQCGRQLLLQMCWDYHSAEGCGRLACKWRHCHLDAWQTSWLCLQRFCFGGQLGTFESLDSFSKAVRIAFSDEARLVSDAPPAVAEALGVALRGLGALGYPFQASHQPAPAALASGGAGHAGRKVLLSSLRELAAAALPAGAEVLPVGSFAWGADTEGSDLDVVITLPVDWMDPDEVLDTLARALAGLQVGRAPDGLQAAEPVIRGRATGVPVMYLRADVDGEPLSADLCVASQLGSVRDAVLFRYLSALNPRLPKMLQLLKRWLRLRWIPTSGEGGYPQVFWMRLAARTYQQLAGKGGGKGAFSAKGRVVRGAESCADSTTASEAAAESSVEAESCAEDEAEAKREEPPRAEAVAEASAAAGGVGVEAEVEAAAKDRALLRGFCSRWSKGLPGWGEFLNFAGEEPTSATRRLANGVCGATALLCLRELRLLASQPSRSGHEAPLAEEDPAAAPPHANLCPAKGPFFGAFLIPGPHEGSPSELVAAEVEAARGPVESVRYCGCSACASAGADGQGPHGFVSRRDGDWVYHAEVIDVLPWDEGEAAAAVQRPRRTLGLLPPHFVCLLQGDPSTSAQACETVRQLQTLLAERGVAFSLPPAYFLNKYSRRTLMGLRAGVRKPPPIDGAPLRSMVVSDDRRSRR